MQALPGNIGSQKSRNWHSDCRYIQDDEIRQHIQSLGHGSRIERVSSALQLAWLESPEATEALMKALYDPEPQVRFAAIEALATFPMPVSRDRGQVIDRLLALTKDPDPHVRRQALAIPARFLTTEEFRGRMLDSYETALKQDDDSFVRLQAAGGLSQNLWSRHASRISMFALHDEFSKVRETAVWGINLACLLEAIEPMLTALKDPVPAVRRAAADRFQWADNPKADQGLKVVAEQDPVEAVRNAASNSLRVIEHHRSKPREDITKECRD